MVYREDHVGLLANGCTNTVEGNQLCLWVTESRALRVAVQTSVSGRRRWAPVESDEGQVG